MNEPIYWDYLNDNIRHSAIDMRERSAINHHKKIFSNKKSFNQWVYGFRYDCLKLVEIIIGRKISGKIIEIGAGTGTFSCVLSKNDEINKIYTLDYSKGCVEILIPFVIKQFNLSKFEEEKIFPVVGSYNNIKLPDNSLDFVIAMGSLHHSENREETLNEIYRVLKVGGYLIACERASYNTRTNYELNSLLEKEYSSEFKKKMGYSIDQKYTRKMNSEHDPLLAEWEYLLGKNGFKNYIFWFLRFTKKSKFRILLLWNVLGKVFFKLFGTLMVKRKITQLLHMKIPYYPWFSKSKLHDDLLIISKKEAYVKMP